MTSRTGPGLSYYGKEDFDGVRMEEWRNASHLHSPVWNCAREWLWERGCMLRKEDVMIHSALNTRSSHCAASTAVSV